LFVCAVFLVFTSTHVFDERSETPVFSPRENRSVWHFPKPNHQFFSRLLR